jgi:MoaA/NifB/PqqE/SkfB family radical SAM enzyme
MTTEMVKSILKEAVGLGCLSVRFTGGEPLLREDFLELYRYARRLGLRVTLFTNACLVTTDLAKIFASEPLGNPIEVSVYGMHPQSYDAVVGRMGAFEEFWRGIELLLEYNIPFVVKQSLLPPNRSEMAEFEAFAAKLPGMVQKPGYSMNFDLRARRDNPAKNKIIKNLRMSPEETLSILTREPKKYIKGMREFVSKFMSGPNDQLFSCGAGLGTCVDAYGNAQMCMLLRHPDTVYPLDPHLHLEKHPETDLPPLHYALKEFFPQIRRMRAKNPAYLQRCAKCFIKGLCEQCPAKSWEEHGTLDTPVEYLCEVAHAQARYLGLLFEGEKSWEIPPEIWKVRLSSFIEGSQD